MSNETDLSGVSPDKTLPRQGLDITPTRIDFTPIWGRHAGRWQKCMLNRYRVGLIFIGSKPVQVSMQPDNPFVNNAYFFP